MRTILMVILAAACLLPVATGQACEIPVFRFALDHWERAACEVVYVHTGQPAAQDAAANAALAQAAKGQSNLNFSELDASHLDDAYEGVRQAIKDLKPNELPTHLVVNGKGMLIHHGRLTAQDVEALIHPPLLKSLCDVLASGKGGVVLLLECGEAVADQTAAKAVGDAIKETASQRGTTSLLTLRRDDQANRWLVRQLLAGQTDLVEKPKPAAFPVIGRGRVLDVLSGEDITVERASEMVGSMYADCSCIIQESSPGVDLLTTFDWAAYVQPDRRSRNSDDAMLEIPETMLNPAAALPGTSPVDHDPLGAAAVSPLNSPRLKMVLGAAAALVVLLVVVGLLVARGRRDRA